jgi:hypothetical protein
MFQHILLKLANICVSIFIKFLYHFSSCFTPNERRWSELLVSPHGVRAVLHVKQTMTTKESTKYLCTYRLCTFYIDLGLYSLFSSNKKSEQQSSFLFFFLAGGFPSRCVLYHYVQSMPTGITQLPGVQYSNFPMSLINAVASCTYAPVSYFKT